MSIVEKGNKFLVTTKDKKKVLGSFFTRADALAMLRAIEKNKKRRGK